jgi:hypothetical protein
MRLLLSIPAVALALTALPGTVLAQRPGGSSNRGVSGQRPARPFSLVSRPVTAGGFQTVGRPFAPRRPLVVVPMIRRPRRVIVRPVSPLPCRPVGTGLGGAPCPQGGPVVTPPPTVDPGAQNPSPVGPNPDPGTGNPDPNTDPGTGTADPNADPTGTGEPTGSGDPNGGPTDPNG